VDVFTLVLLLVKVKYGKDRRAKGAIFEEELRRKSLCSCSHLKRSKIVKKGEPAKEP
jgi:hypothetical protein